MEGINLEDLNLDGGVILNCLQEIGCEVQNLFIFLDRDIWQAFVNMVSLMRVLQNAGI
jgi:hypothetical protein